MCLLVLQIEWQFSRKATVELTHNWGTESDPNFKGYHNGNDEPQGYGHIGLDVPDVAAACKRFSDLGECISSLSSPLIKMEHLNPVCAPASHMPVLAPIPVKLPARICGPLPS